MSRERVFATCKRCGFERDHYTRKNGTKVSPCVMCSRQLAAERAAKQAEDPEAIEARRVVYRRYNSSDKGRARMHRHRTGDEPESG